MDNPGIALIILNWNSWRDTVVCLESVQDLDYPDFRIILVDNGSTDDSLRRIKDWSEGRLNFKTPYVRDFFARKPVRIIHEQKDYVLEHCIWYLS